jgi:hypothetical protein
MALILGKPKYFQDNEPGPTKQFQILQGVKIFLGQDDGNQGVQGS